MFNQFSGIDSTILYFWCQFSSWLNVVVKTEKLVFYTTSFINYILTVLCYSNCHKKCNTQPKPQRVCALYYACCIIHMMYHCNYTVYTTYAYSRSQIKVYIVCICPIHVWLCYIIFFRLRLYIYNFFLLVYSFHYWYSC